MTMIVSHYNTGIPILTNDIGEEIGVNIAHVFQASGSGPMRSLRWGAVVAWLAEHDPCRDIVVIFLKEVGLKNNSFDVPAVNQYERDWALSEQARSSADSNPGRAHDFHEWTTLHPDWRESSGIALPTVEELHYAHHFLIRAAKRRLREVVPASAPPFNPLSLSPPVVAMESSFPETSPRKCLGTRAGCE